MNLFICKQFLRDLVSHTDPTFAARSLRKVIDANGEFIQQVRDDHRHGDVAGAWIRYISTQNTAYRAIFLRKREGIFLYRTGEHNISDNLAEPTHLDEATKVVATPPELAGVHLVAPDPIDRFFRSLEPRLLRTFLAERTTVPHRNLTFVSPQISMSLLSPVGPVGQLFDRVLWGGGTVTLITRTPKEKHLEEYDRIAARGVEVLFHDRVNARLGLLEVDQDQLADQQRDFENTAFIGSAELTETSMGNGDSPHDELCYELYPADYDIALMYCLRLSGEARDIPTYRQQIGENFHG